jgi:hypothetical protein
MWKQVEASASRRSTLPLTEFIANSMSTSTWTVGLFTPFSSHTPRNIGEALPFLGHVGYLTLLLAGAALYWTLRGRMADDRQHLTLVMLGLLVITLTLTMDFSAVQLYRVPLINRFRWPFKLLLFANYFQILLAALGLDHFLENGVSERRRRAAGVACLALSLANALLLYVGTPPKPFRTHRDPVPMEEPLREMLRDGKIFTLGFDVWDPQSAHGLGFNYATLWGLYHFAGYDPLVPQANYDLALGLTYAATFEGPPGAVPWGRLRQWGVRWYVVGNQRWDYDADLRSLGITFVQRDAGRTVYRDPLAKPLAFWEDGRSDPFDVQIRTNSISVNSSSEHAGRLCLNFLYHPRFHVEIDGQPGTLAGNPYGQMLLEVPAGHHSIVVRYEDPDFRLGLWMAAAGALLAVGHAARRGDQAGR